jgi:hypothetical protein
MWRKKENKANKCSLRIRQSWVVRVMLRLSYPTVNEPEAVAWEEDELATEPTWRQ